MFNTQYNDCIYAMSKAIKNKEKSYSFNSVINEIGLVEELIYFYDRYCQLIILYTSSAFIFDRTYVKIGVIKGLLLTVGLVLIIILFFEFIKKLYYSKKIERKARDNNAQ